MMFLTEGLVLALTGASEVRQCAVAAKTSPEHVSDAARGALVDIALLFHCAGDTGGNEFTESVGGDLEAPPVRCSAFLHRTRLVSPIRSERMLLILTEVRDVLFIHRVAPPRGVRSGAIGFMPGRVNTCNTCSVVQKMR